MHRIVIWQIRRNIVDSVWIHFVPGTTFTYSVHFRKSNGSDLFSCGLQRNQGQEKHVLFFLVKYISGNCTHLGAERLYVTGTILRSFSLGRTYHPGRKRMKCAEHCSVELNIFPARTDFASKTALDSNNQFLFLILKEINYRIARKLFKI